MSHLGESICYSVSRFLLTKDLLGRSREVARASDTQGEFEVWREECIQKSLTAFAHIPVAGKTVLDFGCGGGRLARMLCERGAGKIIGVDLNEEVLKEARDLDPSGSRMEFLLGDESAIPVASDSIDLVFCFSVLEHVMDVDTILQEWWRVLRPGGQVLIDWSGWHHPDASHLDSVIPIPYAQCLFHETTLSRTAMRIKRSSFYRLRFWDYDPNGARRDVPMSDRYTENFLNKMSISSFNEKLRTSPYEVTHYQCHPPSWFQALRFFLVIPFLREHLTSFVTYVLTKPERTDG